MPQPMFGDVRTQLRELCGGHRGEYGAERVLLKAPQLTLPMRTVHATTSPDRALTHAGCNLMLNSGEWTKRFAECERRSTALSMPPPSNEG